MKVLKNHAQTKFKFDAALKYVKHMLSVFKSEERRRVRPVIAVRFSISSMSCCYFI